MKTNLIQRAGILCAAAVCAISTASLAQQVTVTEATSASTSNSGVITDYSPGQTIIVRQETSTAPVNYYVTKQTTFVDEAGAPVMAERITAGAPITVQYVREGDRMLASRVVVRKTVTTSPAPMVTGSTTTTTTTTSGTGTIAEFAPGSPTMVIRSTSGTQPYIVSNSTVYVDESGTPITVQNISPGAPVTVHYVREGDRMVASRVVVSRPAVSQPNRKLSEDEKEALEDLQEATEKKEKKIREKQKELRDEIKDRRD